MREVLTVKVSEEFMQALRVAARRNFTNISSIVRQGLARDLQRRGLIDSEGD